MQISASDLKKKVKMSFITQAALRPYGALAVASPYYAYGYPYTAPIGADGNVVDTPEVAAAKAAHFAAHAAAHH